MTIDFYYTLVSTPCRAVLLTAKLLGVEMNLKHVDLLKKEQLAPAFIKINPQHTIPTIVDEGFVLWESYAILSYLVHRYSKNDFLCPNDLKQQAIVSQRMYFDLTTLSPRFFHYYFPIYFENANPDPEKKAKVEEALTFLDAFLKDQEYVAGETLTIADIALVTTLSDIDASNFDLTPYKNVSRWYVKLQSIIPDFQTVTGKQVVAKMFAEFAKK